MFEPNLSFLAFVRVCLGSSPCKRGMAGGESVQDSLGVPGSDFSSFSDLGESSSDNLDLACCCFFFFFSNKLLAALLVARTSRPSRSACEVLASALASPTSNSSPESSSFLRKRPPRLRIMSTMVRAKSGVASVIQVAVVTAHIVSVSNAPPYLPCPASATSISLRSIRQTTSSASTSNAFYPTIKKCG